MPSIISTHPLVQTIDGSGTRMVRFDAKRTRLLESTMRQYIPRCRAANDYEEAHFASRVHKYVKAQLLPYDLHFTDDEWPTISRALRASSDPKAHSLYRWIMKHGNYRADPGPAASRL